MSGGGKCSAVAQSRQKEGTSQDFANRGQWWPWAGCPGWHTVDMSHCAPTMNLAVKMGWLNHLSLSNTHTKKKVPWKCSHGGEEKPYYPATELHTFVSELNLSTQVTCTTSNQQHVPPSSSCMLSGRAWVKPTLARQNLLEMGCSYIQLHSRVTPRSHTTTTYLVHKVPSKVPTR